MHGQVVITFPFSARHLKVTGSKLANRSTLHRLHPRPITRDYCCTRPMTSNRSPSRKSEQQNFYSCFASYLPGLHLALPEAADFGLARDTELGESSTTSM